MILQDSVLYNDSSRSVRQLMASRCAVDCVLELPVRNCVFHDVHKGCAVVAFTRLPEKECTWRCAGARNAHRTCTGLELGVELPVLTCVARLAFVARCVPACLWTIDRDI